MFNCKITNLRKQNKAVGTESIAETSFPSSKQISGSSESRLGQTHVLSLNSNKRHSGFIIKRTVDII